MSSTVVRVSRQELTQIISNVVEQKLVELFGDPDDGLTMKQSLRKRLLRQKRAVEKGDRGTNLSSIRKHLGL
ncbi:MAG: hypothetical protein HYR76_08935 [Ignavibacteria bacterium]|nr:hypothetical protein [Ignavibacteria bacterium]